MLQTAHAHSALFENVLQAKMKYVDLHCDALTNEGVLCCSKENLKKGDCLLQCFAVCLSPKNANFQAFLRYFDAFQTLCEESEYHVVRGNSSIDEEKINALLTVEGGEILEGKLENLDVLSACGVKILTLTWNYPNAIGFPNFPDYEGIKRGSVSLQTREKERGLTPFGFSVVERMNELGMLVDLSHGSDQLLLDVLSVSKKPILASHSNSASVLDCARNLTDKQIKMIADGGGVIGMNFCADFLSKDKSCEGQRRAILAHARAVFKAGGEECLAIGSDFDGTPPNPYLKSPAKMGDLFQTFAWEFGASVAQKIFFGNALRILRGE